jgi:hypothetical protein
VTYSLVMHTIDGVKKNSRETQNDEKVQSTYARKQRIEDFVLEAHGHTRAAEVTSDT